MSENLFFAVFPDLETAERISGFSERFREQHELPGKPVGRPRLHATLIFMGNWPVLPEQLVQDAGRAGALVRQRAFDVVFDRVGSFSERRGRAPLVLKADDGVLGLHNLRDELAQALVRVGHPPRKDSYEPHLTLSYADRVVETEYLIQPFRWRVSQFMLVRSLVGQSRYIPLERWRLGG